MCGIFGYMGPKQAAPILLEGLRRLEYRGYDSSGIALKNGDFSIYKKTGKVVELQSILPKKLHGNIGIAHTRWATHGGVTDPNAHPHLSENGKVVIVHNGIIENSRTLRNLLKKKGVEFNSETDSEVISHVLEYELNRDNSPTDALRRTLSKLVGTWGLCAIFLEHDVIMCARNGSPLIIGQGDGEVFV
ncbi:MAG: class II glutamine amidotransferase, partial [Candidatus Thermoplasmatota archaeon]|nr:class II glutamine amidotransferase [Candidatus Thermoplasmatota archaeon]